MRDGSQLAAVGEVAADESGPFDAGNYCTRKGMGGWGRTAFGRCEKPPIAPAQFGRPVRYRAIIRPLE